MVFKLTRQHAARPCIPAVVQAGRVCWLQVLSLQQGVVVVLLVLLQEAIQRALEENPELAAQLDANYLNKVGASGGRSERPTVFA